MINPSTLLSLFAIMVLVFYIPAFIDPKRFKKELLKFVKDPNSMKIVAILGFVFAILFFSVYKQFQSTPKVIFTIFGWLAIIKSTTILWFPSLFEKMVKFLVKTTASTITFGISGFLFAIILKIIADFYI